MDDNKKQRSGGAIAAVAITVAVAALVFFCSAFGLWLLEFAQPSLAELNVTATADEIARSAQTFAERQFPEYAFRRRVVFFTAPSRRLQYYLELEAGGKDVLREFVRDGNSQPHLCVYRGWLARLYNEMNETELLVAFTPQGILGGFYLNIPEAQADVAPDVSAGRRAFSPETWSRYAQIGYESVAVPYTGRVDDTFTYENSEFRIAGAKFRIELLTTGNATVGVWPRFFVPEAFDARFSEMRSANDLIGKIAGGAWKGFAISCIVVAAIFWVRGRLAFPSCRTAIFAAGLLALLHVIQGISGIPIVELGYDTEETLTAFYFRIGAGVFDSACGIGACALAFFAVGDALDRTAFGQHVSLSALASPRNLASRPVFALVVAGYIASCAHVIYESVAFYVFRNAFGWYTPLEQDTDPNVALAWLPWVWPVEMALRAGLIEELVFRCLALSAAAILGDKIGWRRTAVAVALVAQAVAFGSAHASYPAMPSYFRIVELFLPSLLMGLMFLRWGIVPCVVSHFAYDLVLMSDPTFSMSAQSAFAVANRVAIVACLFAPLIVGTFFVLWQGGWTPSPLVDSPLSSTSPPTETVADQKKNVAGRLPIPPLSRKWLGVAAAAAIFGIALQVCFAPNFSAFPPFAVNVVDATRVARDEHSYRGMTTGDAWKSVAVMTEADETTMRFVWEEAGPSTFRRVFGDDCRDPSVIPVSQWEVTFKKPTGPVEDRQEKRTIRVLGNGCVAGISREIPEGWEGVSLMQQYAEGIAHWFLQTRYYGSSQNWTRTSVESKVRATNQAFFLTNAKPLSNRTDWIFTYESTEILNVHNSSLRVAIKIADGTVTDEWTSVYIPDGWLRAKKESERARDPYKILFAMFAYPTIGLFVVYGGLVAAKSARSCVAPAIALSAAAFGSLFSAESIDQVKMPKTTIDVSQDWNSQLYSSMATFCGICLLASAVGSLYIVRLRTEYVRTRRRRDAFSEMAFGACSSFAAVGLIAVIDRCCVADSTFTMPKMASYSAHTYQFLLSSNAVGCGAMFCAACVCFEALRDVSKSRRKIIFFSAVAAIAAAARVLSAEYRTLGLLEVAECGVLAGGFALLAVSKRYAAAVAYASLYPLAILPMDVASRPTTNVLQEIANGAALLAITAWMLRLFERRAPEEEEDKIHRE